jgi:hypothetical protein
MQQNHASHYDKNGSRAALVSFAETRSGDSPVFHTQLIVFAVKHMGAVCTTPGRFRVPSQRSRTCSAAIGRQLTAYIAGARDPSVVDLWTAGIPDSGVEKRLYLAHSAAMMLFTMDQGDEIRSWFITPQPRLNNRSPALYP